MSITPINKGHPSSEFSFRQILRRGSTEANKFIIDKFGQYTLKDWPGKVRSDDEFKSDIESDKTYYDSLKSPVFDQSGGLPGSKETRFTQWVSFTSRKGRTVGIWWIRRATGSSTWESALSSPIVTALIIRAGKTSTSGFRLLRANSRLAERRGHKGWAV